MAKLEGNILFTGSIGNITAFKRKDNERTILRQRQGISGNRVKNDPAFENTRLNGKEFGGCAKAGSKIKKALSTLTKLADFNISSSFNGICKSIQVVDDVNKRGQRSILFSKAGKLLEGFLLNKRFAFTAAITAPITFHISREQLSAKIYLPKLVPGINFNLQGKFPYFRFTIALGILPDLIYNQEKGYQPLHPLNDIYSKSIPTGWFPVGDPFNELSIDIKLDRLIPIEDSESLLLSIGLEPGVPNADGTINWVKYTGCAQILALR